MAERTTETVLEAVEALEPEACGALVIVLEGQRMGSVFVEHNRVLWAAASGLSQRLRALLRDHIAEAEDSTNVALRAALEEHTIESLIALPDQRGEEIVWVNRERSYQPRFTFSPVELYAAVNARLYAPEAAGAAPALAMLDPTAPGASFVIADEAPHAVRVAGPHDSIDDLRELGGWAEAALGATRGFSSEVMRSAVAMANGDVALAWRTSRSLIHAAVFDHREALERTLRSLTHYSYPAVLTKRVPRSSRGPLRDGSGSVDRNI